MGSVSNILRSGHSIPVSQIHHIELGHRRGIEAKAVPGQQRMAAQQMVDPRRTEPAVAEASDTLLVGGNDLIPHPLSHVTVPRHELVGGHDHLL